jgi:hypothetical protein
MALENWLLGIEPAAGAAMLDDDEEDEAEGFAAWFGTFCPALGVVAPIWAII